VPSLSLRSAARGNVLPEEALPRLFFALPTSFQPLFLKGNHLIHKGLAKVGIFLVRSEEGGGRLVFLGEQFERWRHSRLKRVQVGIEKGIRIVCGNRKSLEALRQIERGADIHRKRLR